MDYTMDYAVADELVRLAAWKVMGGATLTNEERKAIYIISRIRVYLQNRMERGDEIFEKEKKEAGRSTKEFDS